MEIVRPRDPEELEPEDQKFCEATKAWFRIDFVPKMSRVLLTLPQFGRPYGRSSRRAMADGALRRSQKELIATMMSAINVCESESSLTVQPGSCKASPMTRSSPVHS